MKLRVFTAVFLVFCLLTAGCAKKEEKKIVPYTAPDISGTDIAYQSEHYTIGKNSFLFFYLYTYYTSIEPYALMNGLDTSVSFAEQNYSEGLTWKDYICALASANLYNCVVYAEKALAEGFVYDALDKRVEQNMAALETQAQNSGLSYEDYISSYYGDITDEDIKAVFELQAYAYAYNDVIIEEKIELITEDDYTAYLKENEATIAQTDASKNTAHILVSFDFYNTEEEAFEKAEEILGEWQSGEKTLESFEDLSNTCNDDNNCIYENVTRGQMVSEFEDWIYDPERKEGDTDIIKTTYGYHIMYFIGDGEVPWREDAKASIINKAMEEHTEALHTEYESRVAENANAVNFVPDIPPKTNQA